MKRQGKLICLNDSYQHLIKQGWSEEFEYSFISMIKKFAEIENKRAALKISSEQKHQALIQRLNKIQSN